MRLHFLQHWYNLCHPGLEDALYESEGMRRFAGIDLEREAAPEETTILRFRRLLEEHDLGTRPFAEVGRILQERGMKVSGGATIIAAPGLTKNAGHAQPRDALGDERQSVALWYEAAHWHGQPFHF